MLTFFLTMCSSKCSTSVTVPVAEHNIAAKTPRIMNILLRSSIKLVLMSITNYTVAITYDNYLEYCSGVQELWTS